MRDLDDPWTTSAGRETGNVRLYVPKLLGSRLINTGMMSSLGTPSACRTWQRLSHILHDLLTLPTTCLKIFTSYLILPTWTTLVSTWITYTNNLNDERYRNRLNHTGSNFPIFCSSYSFFSRFTSSNGVSHLHNQLPTFSVRRECGPDRHFDVDDAYSRRDDGEIHHGLLVWLHL